MDPVYLDSPIGEDRDLHMGDFTEDRTALVPADATTYQLLEEQTTPFPA